MDLQGFMLHCAHRLNHGKKRVARLMRELMIRSIVKKKYKVTTNSQHRRPVSENQLNTHFDPVYLNFHRFR
jgi:hypothetical protein